MQRLRMSRSYFKSQLLSKDYISFFHLNLSFMSNDELSDFSWNFSNNIYFEVFWRIFEKIYACEGEWVVGGVENDPNCPYIINEQSLMRVIE